MERMERTSAGNRLRHFGQQTVLQPVRSADPQEQGAAASAHVHGLRRGWGPWRLRGLGVSAFSLVLAGCAVFQPATPVPASLPPQQEVQQFQVSACDGSDASLVILQPLSANSWRWLQLDAFGTPKARQIVEDGSWRNDGFLPPNPAARQLFGALTAILTSDEVRTRLYPALQVRPRDAGWQLQWPGDVCQTVQPLS